MTSIGTLQSCFSPPIQQTFHLNLSSRVHYTVPHTAKLLEPGCYNVETCPGLILQRTIEQHRRTSNMGHAPARLLFSHLVPAQLTTLRRQSSLNFNVLTKAAPTLLITLLSMQFGKLHSPHEIHSSAVSPYVHAREVPFAPEAAATKLPSDPYHNQLGRPVSRLARKTPVTRRKPEVGDRRTSFVGLEG